MDKTGGCEGVRSGSFPSDFEDKDDGKWDVKERMEKG